MAIRPKRAPGLSAVAAGALSLLLSLPGVGLPASSGGSGEAGPPPAPGQRPPLAGRSLEEALLALQSLGLSIVFTSQLVRPEMRVEAEPAAADPRLALDELLAPHGLRAEPGAGGTLVVVRAPAAAAPSGAIAGTVRGGEPPMPIAGAVVRVLGGGGAVESGAGGRFEIRGLAPGRYTLEAERQDFLPMRVPGVAVGAGPAAEVDLTLQPLPSLREQIVVRSSQVSLLGKEPLAPLSLSGDDIAALPHLAGDLFRALALLPGTAANDVSAQFQVRGGRRDEVEVRLDGQELYEAYHLHDFDRALSIVEPGELSAASLSTGALPASYGDRMSGLLDLTTAAPAGPRRARLSLGLLGAVAAGGGSFAGDRGSWLASARRGSIDLASRLLGREDPAFWDLFGKATYRLGDGGGLDVHLLEAGDTLGFAETEGGDRKRYDTDYDSSYLWVTHRSLHGDRLLVESMASASEIDRDRRGAESEEEEESRFEVADRRTAETLELGQSWSLAAGEEQTVTWGFSARRYEVDYDYASQVEPDFALASAEVEPRAGLARFARRRSGDHLGTYAADRFSPSPPLTLELGLRYDRHTLSEDTLVSPRASLAWRLSGRDVLRAAWGRYFQSQRPYELQVEDGESRFSPAERSAQWVVGYERVLGGRQGAWLSALRIEAYRRTIADPRPRYANLFEPLNVFPEAEPDRVRIAPGSSRSEGIELVLRGALGSRTSWWANYARASATDLLGGRRVPRESDQAHALNLYADSRLGESWNLSLAWRFHTGWPTTPVALKEAADEEGEPGFLVVLGPLDSERLASYHRLDLRLSHERRLRAGRLVYFVDLQNVYNRRNLAGFDLQVDEEEGRLLSRPETWPGFFPSAGITWDF